MIRHVLTYQIDGTEHDTGRQYRTITQVGILNPDEGTTLINEWNKMARTEIQFTFLHVKPATPEQQIKIDDTVQFRNHSVFRSGVFKETLATESAIKVLQLLDADEDAPSRYSEIVALVAKEMSMTTEQLDAELEPFI